MIPSKIITMARKQSSNTGTGIVSQDEAYDFLNIILADFWKDINDNSVGLDLYTWTYNLVSGTKDYARPVAAAAATLLTSTWGIQQPTKIGVKLTSTQTNYVPVSYKFIEGFLNLPDYYATGQSSQYPVAYGTNTQLTLMPTPTNNVTSGLQIMGPRLHFPLSTATEDVEGCILIPSQWHFVIVEGLKHLMYGARGQDFDQAKTQQKAYYESEKNRAINQLLDRMLESSESFLPDLTALG